MQIYAFVQVKQFVAQLKHDPVDVSGYEPTSQVLMQALPYR